MGASRAAGATVLGFLTDVQARGVAPALKSLNLESLAGRPVDEIFLGIMDYACPNAGTVDEAIARNAFVETIAALAAEGIHDLDSLTLDQTQTVFAMFLTFSIEARLANDIGASLVSVPTNPGAAERAQQALRDFIEGGVRDAVSGARSSLQVLSQAHVRQFVDQVYEGAFQVLLAMGEAEVEDK